MSFASLKTPSKLKGYKPASREGENEWSRFRISKSWTGGNVQNLDQEKCRGPESQAGQGFAPNRISTIRLCERRGAGGRKAGAQATTILTCTATAQANLLATLKDWKSAEMGWPQPEQVKPPRQAVLSVFLGGGPPNITPRRGGSPTRTGVSVAASDSVCVLGGVPPNITPRRGGSPTRTGVSVAASDSVCVLGGVPPNITPRRGGSPARTGCSRRGTPFCFSGAPPLTT